MSRWITFLNKAKEIVEKYDGSMPLSSRAKEFFRQHKQMGSNDRRIVSELIFSFFRLGHALKDASIEERILTGLFLSRQTSSELLKHFKPEWNSNIQVSLDAKLKHWQSETNKPDIGRIFPWRDALSSTVDPEEFTRSFLTQPDLYIRIRPGHEKTVNLKLSEAGVPFKNITENCLSLPNSTQVDTLLALDQEAVIQDYNSQATGDFFLFGNWTFDSRNTKVWDCCAGSGGKSIMAYDYLRDIQLTVSDARESILHNLKRRFEKAGIRTYHSFVADLAMEHRSLPAPSQQLVIADVPCSGSGTWARTPEQLYFFDPAKIQYYSALQKKIVTNVIPALHSGGRLIYITCSVFKEENEAVADFIGQKLNVRQLSAELLSGYTMKADSMFVAVFEK